MSVYKFQCPTCDKTHDRGLFDGVHLFRCLYCGYLGHGFHSDADIDREIYAQHREGNSFNRTHGIPERPLGVQQP